MDDRPFIKLYRTIEAKELQAYPPENHLLSVIAWRTKRTKEFNCKGLKIGQSLLGDFKSFGLTRQKYRSAISNLQKWRFITIQPTNKGSVVTLINMDAYDPNIEPCQPPCQPAANHPANQRLTTIKNDKNEKNEKNKSPEAVLASLNGQFLFLKEKEFYSEFLALLKGRKTRPTEKAIILLLRKLHSYDLTTALGAIRESIMNGWSGVFPKANQPSKERSILDGYN